MIDDHEQSRLVDRWFAVRWRFLAGTLAALSGIAILLASIIQLLHSF